MKKSKLMDSFYTLGFILAITAICVSGVSWAYQATKARIKANQTLDLKKAALYAAGIKVPEKPGEIEKLFNEKIKKDGSRYLVKNGGYVYPAVGTGLWGKIKAMIGVDKKFNAITGIYFTSQNETPGLGARIDEEWFKKQFRGKLPPLTTVAEGAPTTDRQFDAITGATITSNGVKNMVNKLFSYEKDKKLEEKQ